MIVESKAIYVYISTGEKTAMYTLRVMCEDKLVIGGETSFTFNSYYCKNLSNNKELAEEKAEAYAEAMGIPFKGDANFELNEIKRQRDALAKEKREALERAYQEKIEKEAAERAERVVEGIILVGKYEGQTAEMVWKQDKGYIWWLASMTGCQGKLGISADIAAKFIADNKIEQPGYVGIIGEELETTLTLRRCSWTSGQYPTLMWLCEDEEGREVVFFSVAKAFKELDIGETFKVKGLVKDQRDGWNGNKQTILNKPKKVK